MKLLTPREAAFRARHLNCVQHITLDPDGPGVVRLHLIPPRRRGFGKVPYLVLINGSQLLPLTTSWAILLVNFMRALQPYEGKETDEAIWNALSEQAVKDTCAVYPHTPADKISRELAVMLEALVDVARGREPRVAVGLLSLGEYADQMTAPHRMDLMVSAMTKNGAWHCNQKCLHCYAAGQPLSETKELSTQQWLEVLDRLRRAGVPQVTFTGGEPTLRSDLVQLVEAARWFVTRLNTNGQLLTPALCEQLRQASLDSVQVTLYSHDAAVHNRLVGAETFEKTVQGIRSAVAAGLNVSVNTPLCSWNADYAATLRFAAGLGVRYATCSGLIPAGGATGDESKSTRLTPEALTESLRLAKAAADELHMEIDFTSPGWLSEEVLRGLGYALVPSCGACLSNMAIAPDGEVVPCQSWLGGKSLGNILTTPWKRIWNSAACGEIRAESAKMEHICQLHTGNKPGKEGC